jgi:ribosomal protein S18 acetylase RimI-like enzyme
MTVTIEKLDAADLDANLDALADILHTAVQAGSSVGFIWPFSREDARTFFAGKVRDGVAGGKRVLFAASVDGRVLGTVQLDMDLPPNQIHRADVAKLLVHPDARRQGLARKLMIALEDEAQARALKLLVLDTRTGDAAEPLYSGLGYKTTGQIPYFAMAPEGDRLDATTYMFKRL